MPDQTDEFLERLRKRALLEKGRSQHRPAFIAAKPLVRDALQAGFTLKAIWQQLRHEDKIAMSYEAFRTHCKNAGLSRKRSAARSTANSDDEPSAPHRFQHNAGNADSKANQPTRGPGGALRPWRIRDPNPDDLV